MSVQEITSGLPLTWGVTITHDKAWFRTQWGSVGKTEMGPQIKYRLPSDKAPGLFIWQRWGIKRAWVNEIERDAPYLTAVWSTVPISHCYFAQCTQEDCVTQAWNADNTSDSWIHMKSTTCDASIKPVSKEYSHRNILHNHRPGICFSAATFRSVWFQPMCGVIHYNGVKLWLQTDVWAP